MDHEYHRGLWVFASLESILIVGGQRESIHVLAGIWLFVSTCNGTSLYACASFPCRDFGIIAGSIGFLPVVGIACGWWSYLCDEGVHTCIEAAMKLVRDL